MSRLNRIKEQYKELDVSLIDILEKCDPSENRKYLEFILKMLSHDFRDSDNILEKIGNFLIGDANVDTLNKFHEHCEAHRIKKSDIGSYRDWYSIHTVVEEADEIKRKADAEKKIKRVYDENGWMVLIPLSFESAQAYGSGTKWCITQLEHWNNYYTDYKLIYVIDKNANKKYAVSVQFSDNEIQGWLADDTEINPILLDIPKEVMSVLISEIKIRETNGMLMGDSIKEDSKKTVNISDWVQRYFDDRLYNDYGVRNDYSDTVINNNNYNTIRLLNTNEDTDREINRVTTYIDFLKTMY